MITLKLCRNTFVRLLFVLVIISSILVSSGFCQETEDSQLFIAGFNAYQQKDYSSAIEKMNEVLQKHPDSPLRDMVIFWLSRSYFKAGDQQNAARYMSQFAKEYPDNPLKGTVEEELLNLVSRYEKGEKLATVSLPAKSADKQAALQKAKAEEERLAREKADKDRLAKEEAEKKRLAQVKADEERKAAAKAQQELVAQEKLAAEKAEKERLAGEEAEKVRLVQVKAEEERKAAEKTGQERIAQEKLASEKAEQMRLAQEKAEQERLSQVKAAEEHKAAVKAEQERLAREGSEKERRAQAKAEQERAAAEKAATAAEAARQAAAKQEQERLAALLTEEQKQAKQREAEEKQRAEKAAMREKAIAQYKSVIEKYPSSAAATAAIAKLRELGITVALPPQAAAVEQKPAEQPENSQLLRLEVVQYAGFEFNLLPRPQIFEVARRINVPFEITNHGNGNDSFYLESGFPQQFNAGFAAAAAPEQSINQTPILAPGESFKGLVTLTIPASSIDGLRITHPVKAASRYMSEASQSREVALVASAPLLRAVVKSDKAQLLPGGKVTYRIAVLNVGSTAAQNVTLRLNFPPQLDPVDYATAGFRQEMKAAVVLDGLQINSGESKDFTVTFQLKDDSLAGQELLCRAELINNPLKTEAAFISNVAYVQPQHGIAVSSGAERLIVIPGQTVTVPFVVTNTGNVREKFKIASTVNGAQEVTFFHDLNRDGIHQSNEPAITEIGPLEPKEETGIAMEIKTQRAASDGSEGNIKVTFVSEGDASGTASRSALLLYSRPMLRMAMSSGEGRIKPGEIASFDLTITNHGSNLARVVELQSVWPELLELVAAEPANSSVDRGNILWKFSELGAGEKRSIRVSFRVKPGTVAGTNIQVNNVLKYEDQLGNRY